MSVHGAAVAQDSECYDLKVRARAVSQVPTPIPNEPGYIVIGWPWFVDLKVKKVIDGELQQRKIETLAVLHSSYVSKTRTWLLRRNNLGGFNVLRVPEPDRVERCGSLEPPANTYLTPPVGRTLSDERRAAEEMWKRDYTDEDD
ncbi:hypothetical protein [Altererythrobacter xiamenensis]|uniref:hypothetical protein n=1 Tax=Altererythrobacter xiamenensis TaxID=1316679 RepID=UPI0011783319|nr:hypothetical protein [Altererythrobacter xiamenensis]